MKNFMCIVCILITFPVFGQNGFTYQARLNVVPIPQFNYAGGGRLGIETLHRKYNLGAEVLIFMVDEDKSAVYSSDSVFRRTLQTSFIGARGITLSIMRAIPFKASNNRWVFGGQAFAGVNRQLKYSTRQVYDTLYGPRGRPSGLGWYNSDARETETIKHGLKSSFALTIFARLELSINRRFTFSPEFQVAFCLNNRIGGDVQLESMPGVNFCLGYRFGKLPPVIKEI